MALKPTLVNSACKPFASLSKQPSTRVPRNRAVWVQAVNAPASVCHRRGALLLLSGVPVVLQSLPALAGGPAEVGTYLPPANIDSFVQFVPDSQKTPALRGGVIKPESPYTFALPPKFREGKVANINSGNFCQPKCGEPWTEVIFESDAEGKVEVIAAPLVKLTNKVNAGIEELGAPMDLLNRVGPYITGTGVDEEDVLSATTKKQDDNRTYYYYELYAPYGTRAAHSYTACVTKGEVLFIFVVSGSDKQWPKSQATLKKVVESFRASGSASCCRSSKYCYC